MKAAKEPTTGATEPAPQSATLDDLQQQAAALEQQEASQAQEPTKQEIQRQQSAVDDLFDALRMARDIAGPAVWWMTSEKFAAVWSDARIRDISSAGAAIMERHGWTLAQVVGKYAPYVALAAALAAPTLETVRTYKEAQAVAGKQPAPETHD